MARKAEPRPSGLPELKGEQKLASTPGELVWLSASAGTGKTQVLSARVLRLLLHGVPPETILCLTFTKAGASEMANRVNRILAGWVMADEHDLFGDLEALGEDCGPAARDHARTLFASLLDARGGGLRIQTIHSFCQSLLGSFPVEAGLAPGFRLIEDRDAALLAHSVFADMISEAEAQDDQRLIRLAGEMGLTLGEERAMSFLRSLAPHARTLEALPSHPEGMRAWTHRTFSEGMSDIWETVRLQLGDPAPSLLADFASACEAWGTPTGQKHARPVRTWLAADLPTRVSTFGECEAGWLTQKRTPRSLGKNGPALEATEHATRLFDWSDPIHGMIKLAEQADRAANFLLVGRAYAMRHARAKQERGVVDYDDLISRTVALLKAPGMGEWVRYKLDQTTDHILIDEAQDTNEAQWDIIKALTEDYFAGAGARGNRTRTLFTVGDFKQAIFGFQGTDPENFRSAQSYFTERAAAAQRELHDLSLSRSFRSAQPILDVADAVIEAVGHGALGLEAPVPPHVSADASWPGQVTLVPPLLIEEDGEADGEEEWSGEADRLLASRLADQIHHWWKEQPLWLARKGRTLQPGDVMILLRQRKELARLLVARLHERGIPVAGLDRLRLGAPLAVQDLLACARFAMQPEDDLNLAALLVSPLIGLTQDELYQAAHGRKGALWPHLDEALRARLLPLLNAADMISPLRFFETILSGPMEGRKRLLARLGDEARDPVNAFLAAAQEFEANHPPSLQLFLDWFDRSDTEIKRDAESSGGAVRVMTAHGAKGLQAPVVILADATGDPARARITDITIPLDDGTALPLPRPPGADRTLSLKELDDQRAIRAMEEHRRLLYVALTRAEERLLIVGALKRGGVPANSWHADVDAAMTSLGARPQDDPVWPGPVHHYGHMLAGGGDLSGETEPVRPVVRPLWLDQPAPVEAVPARPLAPSAMGRDDEASAPAEPALIAAAERGRLLHALFERLPAVAPAWRRDAAERWLARSAGVDDPALRQSLANTALDVIEHPDFAAYFATDGLAEAPLAGVVDGFVVAGTIDRLIVTDTDVRVIDFKTGRFVPPHAEAVPTAHVRQMSAYAAVLAGVFPGRAVRAALLYTQGPRLIDLPQALLDRHKPDLSWQQEVLPGSG